MLMGSSYPFAKDVLAVMSPLLYSASRYVVAGLFLFAVLVVMRRPMALPRRDWLPMLVLSLVGVALFQACWGLAMARTPPSVGSIVMTTTTAFAAILAWVQRPSPAGARLGRHLDRLRRRCAGGQQHRSTRHARRSAASTARCCGCSPPSPGRSMSSAVRYNLRLGALRVLAWTTLIGSLLLLPVALAVRLAGRVRRLDDRPAGLYWLYTAIFPVGVAFLGLTVGLERLGVSRVMVYMYLIPVAGVGLSAAFFGDPLTAGPRAGGPDRARGRHSDARRAGADGRPN